MKKTLAAILLASLATAAMAQQTVKPEDMIKFRKAGMNFLSWNMGKIKANVDGNFNKDQVVAAANVVAAIANSGHGALFGSGTEKDVGSERTRVRPELFQQPDKVRELAMGLSKEASELARVAATGDVAAIRTQFGKTGATCKSCHDEFRRN